MQINFVKFAKKNQMETLTIKVKNDKALRLIQDLEDLNLIEIITGNKNASGKKLSEILAGSVSPKLADKMQSELSQMRSEWR